MAEDGSAGSGGVTRRGAVVGAASALLLAGCTPVRAAPLPTPSPSPSPPGPRTWDALRRALRGRLLRPADAGYADAARLQNPRYDGARPLGIAMVADAADVVTCLAFAHRAGVPVAIRSGGHGYAGWSAGGAAGTGVPPSLVISTAGLDRIRIDGERATIGPGARLIDVYTALARGGRALGGGTCPTVAIGGLTLGGGIGVLDRSVGLTCDQLVGLTIVTADGRVRHVSAEQDPDLFWAARGGGTGTLGVVTELTFTTKPAPGVTRFVVPVADAASALDAWQRFAPDADERLWTSLHLLVRPGAAPQVSLVGAWTGDDAALAGVLAPLRRAAEGAFGALDAVRNDYGAAMRAFAGCGTLTAAACRTGPGGALQREAEAATSSIVASPLTERGIATLLERSAAGSDVTGMRQGGILLDALGGAVARVPADATAFPHRAARCTVQYTATFATGADPAPFDRYVRASRAAMAPFTGDAAYANYVDVGVQDPGRAYFGANLDRLRRTIATVDPDRVFHQPHFV